MPVHNEDIASVFDEIADLLEIEGDNPFRIRAGPTIVVRNNITKDLGCKSTGRDIVVAT